VFPDELRETGIEGPARAAPRRPEVYDSDPVLGKFVHRPPFDPPLEAKGGRVRSRVEGDGLALG